MRTITLEVPDGLSETALAHAFARVCYAAEQIFGHAIEVSLSYGDRQSDIGDLTRPQELAADAMAALHGRSRVRRLADGAAVIVGMLDDIEREYVCVEADGRERWRRY
jgi:hypothetical protein